MRREKEEERECMRGIFGERKEIAREINRRNRRERRERKEDVTKERRIGELKVKEEMTEE